MYNRYIPQPDGSHRRTPYPDAAAPSSSPPPSTEGHRTDGTVPPCPKNKPESQIMETPQKPANRSPRSMRKQRCGAPQPRKNPGRRNIPRPANKATGNSSNFLGQLLPKDLDTGDLLVIVLLLLMAGDCPEDKENALLTLALYLFL